MGGIDIDIGLLGLDKNIIAGILAHEFGHLVIKEHHRLCNGPQEDYKKEDQADRYAARFMAKHNYKLEPLLSFFNSVSPQQDEILAERNRKLRIYYEYTKAFPDRDIEAEKSGLEKIPPSIQIISRFLDAEAPDPHTQVRSKIG